VADPSLLRADPSPGIRLLTLNRPDRLNALSWELVDRLAEEIDRAAAEPGLRALLITGAGRGFCSGLDLAAGPDPVGAAGSINLFYDRQEKLGNLVKALAALPFPAIAAVNGPAAGGGMALALACDLRVADPAARFNVAFVRIGLSGCDMGVSYTLPRLVGTGPAAELMLTGRFVEAEEALALGLVNRVAPAGGAVEAALGLAGEIARNSPFGVRMTKQVLGVNAGAGSLAAAIELENRTQAVAARSPEAAEALAAFLEKREPDFAGAAA
jgi:enoyl-CoA hydratase